MHEFDLINTFFAAQIKQRSDVNVGIGDDAAIVTAPKGMELAITTDTLVSGVHFLASTLPYDIGYKALAVNLSDLAAMGATPAWITLALTLPSANETWIQDFCSGFFTLANCCQVQLIGGDITHGPLSITIQAIGFVPPGKALLRSQAMPSDLIYVTGTLGDAGLALQALQHHITLSPPYQQAVVERLHHPEPRIETGRHLIGIAHAAIDISDGLAADLTHILEASQVGATLYVDQLPISEPLTRSLSEEDAIHLALTAGDDYELCFTIPAEKRSELETVLAAIACRFTCIGVITAQPGLDLRYQQNGQDGKKYHGAIHGYQHF